MKTLDLTMDNDDEEYVAEEENDEEEQEDEDDDENMLDLSEMLQSFLTNDVGENVVDVLGKITQELHTLNKTLSKFVKNKP
jgi:hypothetical protein